MGSKWITTTIGNFCPFTYGKGLPEKIRINGLIKVYGSNGIVGTHHEPLINGPGIIIGRKGTVGAVHFSAKPFWPIDTTFYITSDSNRDLRFTYYLLKSLGLEHMNSDSAVPGLNREAAHAKKIIVPELVEQCAIAHILGSLDDKIDLNRKMNETLEAMAQALFKSWFVDFDPVIDNALVARKPIPDELKARSEQRKNLGKKRKPLPKKIQKLFPDEFVKTDEIGWVPKGWKIKTIDELVDLIGGGTPKTSIPDYWDGNIPWFSVVDAPNISDVFVISTEKNVTELGVRKSSTNILPIGATIISARGTVGKCAMVGVPMAMNQSCYGIKGKEGISDSFVYYTVREKVADLKRSGHGSVFNTITRDTFKTIKLAFGPIEITQELEKIIQAFFNKIMRNLFNSRELSIIRDLLLPKLLSGELRISKLEKLMEKFV